MGERPNCDEPTGRLHDYLLNANLLKMRGDLDGAIAECISALRIDPDSLEAHSMLGDIYMIQGKVDEANRWYRLALDLDTVSQEERDRLHKLLAAKPKTRKSLPPMPIVAAAVLLVLLAAAAIFLTREDAPKEVRYAPQPRKITAPLNVAVEQKKTEETPSTPQEKVDITPKGPAEEAEIATKVNASETYRSSTLSVVGVTLDPRDTSAVLTVSAPMPQEPAEIVRYALIAAREFYAAESRTNRVTVRVSCPVESREEVIFVGATEREKAMQVDPAQAGYQEIAAVFTETWWRSAK